MAETKNKIPPRDSWIELKPGGSFSLHAGVLEEWRVLTAQCRAIRGNVLARCFEVEYLLDQVICETMIPASEASAERRDLFDDLYLKGPSATFRNKIDVLGKLRSRVSRLRELLPEDTIERLTKIREFRNDFAHYPVTFEPVDGDPARRLRPVLVSRRGRFTLDDIFLTGQAAIADSVVSDLERAFKALMPDANTVAPNSALEPTP